MKFSIEWKEGAIRQLEKMPRPICSRIVKKIESLQNNPFSKIKKLKGSECFRLRVGDYRIILDIDTKNKKLIVLRVGHRKNIYDKRG